MYLNNWNPEDASAWDSYGKKIAYKNLIISTFCLTISFAVWVFWSVLSIKINDYGFNFNKEELFTIVAMPGIFSVFARLVNSFVLPIFGGKKLTIIATALLLIPTIGLVVALQDNTTSYIHFIILAILCGLAGGTFSSSMSNISGFFPKKLQGTALGINGGLGNIGISIFQLISPFIIAIPLMGKEIGGIYLVNAIAIWVPIIILGVVMAFFMDDIPQQAGIVEQFIVFKRLNTYATTFLYCAAFGTYIGCSVSFPLLAKLQFSNVNFIKFVFIGPLLGALFRVVGGILADKVGATKMCYFSFVLMIIASMLVMHSMSSHEFLYFFFSFMLLFTASGIANGSVFALIGKVFVPKEKGVAVALSAAFASGGAFFVPKLANFSIDHFGGASFAFGIFGALYLVGIIVLWTFYRKINN